jgi:hypothetical protein
MPSPISMAAGHIPDVAIGHRGSGHNSSLIQPSFITDLAISLHRSGHRPSLIRSSIGADIDSNQPLPIGASGWSGYRPPPTLYPAIAAIAIGHRRCSCRRA